MTNPSGTQSVERALAVLDALAAADGDLGVSEIAQRTGLPVSTVHRLVRALQAAGLVDRDPGTGLYLLGPALIPLGQLAQRRLGYGRAEPVLEELARSTGESVNLGIRVADDVLVVVDIPSAQPLRFDQSAGSRVPIHTSAMGKCLLAFSLDPDRSVGDLADLTGVTERTITDRRKLRDALQDVRRNGWALNDEERNPGVRAIAVPVLGPQGIAAAAIAVQGPTARLDDARLVRLAEELTSSARRIAPLISAQG